MTLQNPHVRRTDFRVRFAPVFLVVLFLSGCSAAVVFDSPYHLASTNRPRLKVAVDARLLQLKEKSDVWGLESGTYEVGKALLHVLEDDSAAPLSLVYESSNLDARCRLSIGISFFESDLCQADYSLIVTVRGPSQRQVVDARGRGQSGLNSFNAAQEAIEKAILDLHGKLILFGREEGRDQREILLFSPNFVLQTDAEYARLSTALGFRESKRRRKVHERRKDAR